MMRMWIQLSLIFLLGCATTGRSADVPVRHVVVTSVDGLPSYILGDSHASLPVIRKLKGAGVAAEAGMRVANPSVTWPNHTTLMTGVYSERHGVLFNGVAERPGRGQAVRIVPGNTDST